MSTTAKPLNRFPAFVNYAVFATAVKHGTAESVVGGRKLSDGDANLKFVDLVDETERGKTDIRERGITEH